MPDQTKQITDRINESEIKVDKGKITILGNFEWSTYQDTNSMLPVLDYGSNGIYVPVNRTTTLYVGDIIAFSYDNSTITHRIIEINNDREGLYYITKGDYLPYNDGIKIRKSDIKRVLVGIIW